MPIYNPPEQSATISHVWKFAPMEEQVIKGAFIYKCECGMLKQKRKNGRSGMKDYAWKLPGQDWVPFFKQPLPICTITAQPPLPEKRKPLEVKGHVFKNTQWKRVALNKEIRTGICIYCALERYQERYVYRSSKVCLLIAYKENGGLLVKSLRVKLPPCKKKEYIHE